MHANSRTKKASGVSVLLVITAVLLAAPSFATVGPSPPTIWSEPACETCETLDNPGVAGLGVECPVNTGPVNLRNGSVTEQATDLIISNPTFSTLISRTYNSETQGTGSMSLGDGWMGSPADVYLYPGDNQDVELISSATSRLVFGYNAGSYDSPEDVDLTLQYDSQNHKYTLTNDVTGDVWIFHDFTISGCAGRLDERTTKALQYANKTGTTYSYSNGQLDYLVTPADQSDKIDYAYSTNYDDVIVYNGNGGGATAIKKVRYTHFISGTHHGNVGSSSGDLVQVKVSILATDGSTWINRCTQYRYNSDGRLKAVYEPDAVQRIIDYYGFTGTDPEDTVLTKLDSYQDGKTYKLSDFATRSYTYYSDPVGGYPSSTTDFGDDVEGASGLASKYGGSLVVNTQESKPLETMVATVTCRSSCSDCGGSGNSGVTRRYYYLDVNGGSSNSTNETVRIVVEDTLDGGDSEQFRKLYAVNNEGRQLREVLIEDPTETTLTCWCQSWTFVADTSSGVRDRHRVDEYRTPAAHTDVDANSELAQFLDPYDASTPSWSYDLATLNDSSGLIYHYYYEGYSSVTGYPKDTRVKEGQNGTYRYISATDYGDGDDDEPYHVVLATYAYPDKSNAATRSNGIATTYSYDFWDTADKVIKKRTATLPMIATSDNGAGDDEGDPATTIEAYYDKVGRLRWHKDGEGYIAYCSYQPYSGRLAYIVRDADQADLPDSATDTSNTKWLDPGDDTETGHNPTRDTSLPTANESVTQAEFDDLGRVIKSVEEDGRDTGEGILSRHYARYNADAVIQFPYWDNSTKCLVPIRVIEIDDGGTITEAYTIQGDQAESDSSHSTLKLKSTAAQSHYVSWNRLTHCELDGNLKLADSYFDIPSTAGQTGTVSTDFHRTAYRYDDLGLRQYVIQQVSGTPTSSGVEQITEYVDDVLGRVIKAKRAVHGSGSNIGNDYDSNYPTMQTVAETEYDGGYDETSGAPKVGNSHVTKTMAYNTTDGEYAGANYYRSFRGDLRGVELVHYGGASESTVSPYIVHDVDWMGRTIATAAYTSAPTWTGGGGVLETDDYADSPRTNRRTLSKASFDDLGRVYQAERYFIHPTTGGGATAGDKGDMLVSEFYFDRNDRAVGVQPRNEAAIEHAYDGLGRRYQTRVVKMLEGEDEGTNYYTSGKFNYRDPQPKPTIDVSAGGGNDLVIQMEHGRFDAAGNVTRVHSFEMNHDDTTDVGINLSATTDYVRSSVYQWYDDADRLKTVADYGAGSGTSGIIWEWNSMPNPGSEPTGSTAYALVATLAYNSNTGRLESTAEKQDSSTTLTTKYYYDDLGRRTHVAENWDDFSPPSTNTGDSATPPDITKDRVTQWKYNGLGSVTELIAMDANGDGTTTDNQSTKYFYENTYDASLATRIEYPDKENANDVVTLAYHLDGTLNTHEDQRDVTITFDYNSRRQTEWLKVTFPDGQHSVDTDVEAIKYAHDSLGRVQKVTSYEDTAGSTVENEIEWERNGLGQVTKSKQDHDSAAGAGTPDVDYGFDATDTTPDDGVYDNGMRLNQVTYPDGEIFAYDYGDGSLDDRLHRVAGIWEDAVSTGTQLTEYEHSGVGRLVFSELTPPQVRLNRMVFTSAGRYWGWDPFGRTINQYWQDTGAPAVTDFVTYAYDYTGNRLTRDVYDNATKDQRYYHDHLNRLDEYKQGSLSGTTISSVNQQKDWKLDALSNWLEFDDDGDETADHTRAHNDANEITSIDSSGGDVDYDAAGNMIEVPKPTSWTDHYDLTYDAFNRLVKVVDGANTVAEYEYDGLGRRIVKRFYDAGSHDYDHHYYYAISSQVLEVRKQPSGESEDEDPVEQYVYHPHYVDSPAVRYYDKNGDGDFGTSGSRDSEEFQFYTFDANANVTALLEDDGSVLERYNYTPYGEVKCYAPDWTGESSSSSYSNPYLYTGRRFDEETGFYHFRARPYHAQLARFLSRDPIGYDGGQANLYGYVGGAPTAYVDPFGLDYGLFGPGGTYWGVQVGANTAATWHAISNVDKDFEAHQQAWQRFADDVDTGVEQLHPFRHNSMTTIQFLVALNYDFYLVPASVAMRFGTGPRFSNFGAAGTLLRSPTATRTLTRGGGTCFPAGTPVATEEGLRPIEDVTPQTKVWAYDLKTSRWTTRSVEQTLVHQYDGDLVRLVLGDDTLEATGNHRFWVVSGEDLDDRPPCEEAPARAEEASQRGRWVEARHLRVGDVVTVEGLGHQECA